MARYSISLHYIWNLKLTIYNKSVTFEMFKEEIGLYRFNFECSRSYKYTSTNLHRACRLRYDYNTSRYVTILSVSIHLLENFHLYFPTNQLIYLFGNTSVSLDYFIILNVSKFISSIIYVYMTRVYVCVPSSS